MARKRATRVQDSGSGKPARKRKPLQPSALLRAAALARRRAAQRTKARVAAGLRPEPRAIHKNIKARRRALKLTQLQLAVLCDVDKTAVSHWENGLTSPTNERIPIVALALRLTVDELYAEAL